MPTTSICKLDDEFIIKIRRFGRKDCVEAIAVISERLQVFEMDDYYLAIPIISLPLSIRAHNALGQYGFQTVHDIIIHGLENLTSIRNLGPHSAEEIKHLIQKVMDLGCLAKGISEEDLHKYLSPDYVPNTTVTIKY
jgi:DNA-directed RNA polymerase alpha subunit